MKVTLGGVGSVSITEGGNTVDVDSLDADALAETLVGLLARAGLYGYNGATWDRIRSEGQDRDAIAAATLGYLQAIGFGHLFNGTSWDRHRAAGAAQPLLGSGKVTPFYNPTIEADTDLNDSDKTLTVPANTQWRLLSAHALYTSTATVGNRQLRMLIETSAFADLFHFLSPVVQAESLIWSYSFLPGQAREAAVIGTTLLAPMPQDLWLPPASIIRFTDLAAIDAAADDMVITMMVDERSI